MTTFRIKHSKNYTVISNDAIRDKTLSLRARGLHHLLLSYQDDWVVNEKYLVSSTDKEGREAIRAAIRELESAGYLIRNQGRASGTGKFVAATYDVFELPQSVPAVAQKPAHGTVAQKTDVGLADIGLAVDGLTDDGKPDDIISTNSTKYLKTKYLQREEGKEAANAAPAPAAVVEISEPEANPEPQEEIPASLVKQAKDFGQERGSGVGGKRSAAARRPKINAERWIETYNRHKPDKWATCAAMNEKRSKAIAKAVEAVGEEKALELLAAGLSHLRVSPDAWWRDKAMGIDNALANLRFIGWGEAGLSAGLNPQAVAESGLTDSQIQSARRQKEAAGSRVVQIMEESRRKREEAAAALRARALPFN